MEEKILVQGKSSKQYLNTLLTGSVLAWVMGIIAIIYGFLMPFFPLLFSIGSGIVFGILGVVLLIARSCAKKVYIKVTNSRIYGIRGRFTSMETNLPIDSINSIDSITKFNGKEISIRTTSSSICFIGIDNADKIIQVINDLIAKRQKQTNTTIFSQPESVAEEIKKFKNLLDQGIITQEEFNKKKKQFLNK